MQPSATLDVELLTAVLRDHAYINDINQNENSQSKFLNKLKLSALVPQDILRLIGIVDNKEIKSLLLILLLSQTNYVRSLDGESVLHRLENKSNHAPSRLNGLVHLLNPDLLTSERIHDLHQEAVVSILCSVPHFHLLQEDTLKILLDHSPQSIVSYWLYHYGEMPNAHFLLVHLIKLRPADVFNELRTMENRSKERILSNIMKHLDYFDPIPEIIYEFNEEAHLILAMHRVLSGNHFKSYHECIERLLDKLLNQNHHFSASAIRLIISLNDQNEFQELNNKTAYLMKHYLRMNAAAGAIDLFYIEGRANSRSMTQRIQLKPTSDGVFQVTHDNPSPNDAQNPLLHVLNSLDGPITAFDYYLIHFKGNPALITQGITDYLNCYRQEDVESRCQPLHNCIQLMSRVETPLPVREAIFNSFLRYPDLYDTEIIYRMFLFGAQHIIEHFGKQGGEHNYQHVIHMCNEALKRLEMNKHNAIIKVATTALSEAHVELTFHTNNGFFASLFLRLKRCWIYGWTGFFSPNQPTYVKSATSDLSEDGTITQTTPVLPLQSKRDLPSVLINHKKSWTQELLNELIDAWEHFSFKLVPKSELKIRLDLNKVFSQTLQSSRTAPELKQWLQRNQLQFIENRLRIIELLLIKESPTELDLFIKEANNDLPFSDITNEFARGLPLQKIPTHDTLPAKDVQLNTLELTMKEQVTNAWSWAKNNVTSLFSVVNSNAQPNHTNNHHSL